MNDKTINNFENIRIDIQKVTDSDTKDLLDNIESITEDIRKLNKQLNISDKFENQNINEIASERIVSDKEDNNNPDSDISENNISEIEEKKHILEESLEKEALDIEKNLHFDDLETKNNTDDNTSENNDQNNSQDNKKDNTAKLEKLAGDIFNKNYINVIEAIIFSSDEPVKPKEIINIIYESDGKNIKLNENDIETAIQLLNKKYDDYNLSFHIKKLSNGFIFATKEDYSNYLSFMDKERSKKRLSQSALETLSIIAYKQPITKAELEKIRGVNSDYIISTLLEKKLITIVGRAESPGRPLLYGTTDEFLIYFGLSSLSDLPKPREVDEIIRDPDFEEQKRKILAVELDEEAVIKDQQQGDVDGNN